MMIRYSLYFLVMALYTAPLLGVPVMPPGYLRNWEHGAIFLLVIHEFSGFIFFGHTLFSNIWAMRIRMTADHATGVMARAMLRKMALCARCSIASIDRMAVPRPSVSRSTPT